MSTGSSGLGLTGNWARSDTQRRQRGLNFGVPLGPLTATVGAKALYLSPKDGKSGGAVALGGGLEWEINRYFSLHGEGYLPLTLSPAA